MNRGKHICNQLKAVRRRIAEENEDWGKPAKVYRSILRVGLMALLPLALAVFLLYGLLMFDAKWWHWVFLLLGIIALVWCAITWLRHIGDRIDIFEKGIRLTKAQRKVKGGDWKPVKDVSLPWRNIRAISRTEEPLIDFYPRHFRRWIWLYTRGGPVYRLSPDLYDTFFLEKKLRRWWSDGA
ncbi:MAG: hypothetical protein IJ634_03910 [Bacteroidales bacterium]|nr:hypothetical protein [Bacteroidales bacterium]